MRTQPWHDGRPHSLYLLSTNDDISIYIGVTCNLEERLKRHAREKAWWQHVDRMRVEVYPDRHHGFRAERLAIWWFDPIYNIAPGYGSVPRSWPGHNPLACDLCLEFKDRERHIRDIESRDDAPDRSWWAQPPLTRRVVTA